MARWHLASHLHGLGSGKVAIFIIAVIFAVLAVRGLHEATDVNDYDVLRHGAQLTLERSTELYRAPSQEGRHFLYPPTAGLLLAPLGLMPSTAGSLLFAFCRLAALVVVIGLARRWLEREQEMGLDPLWWWIALAALAVCLRAILNDFGNGQINIHLSALIVGGLWLANQEGVHKQLAGGALLGAPIAIKATPLIFLLVLVLHKRWLPLGACLLLCLVLFSGVFAWFGPEVGGELWRGWDVKVGRMAMDAASPGHDLVVSIPELVLSLGVIAGDTPTPRFARAASVVCAILTVLLFLAARQWKSRHVGKVPMSWDVAAITVCAILVSPLVRKAHLVALLFPLIVLITSVCLRPRPSSSWAPSKVLLVACSVLLLAGTSLPLQHLIPSYQANPTLLLGCLVLACGLVAVPTRPPGLRSSSTGM